MNIKVESQHKQRKVAAKWSDEDLIAESTPFVFYNQGQQEIKSAPWVYMANLNINIKKLLDSLKQVR